MRACGRTHHSRVIYYEWKSDKCRLDDVNGLNRENSRSFTSGIRMALINGVAMAAATAACDNDYVDRGDYLLSRVLTRRRSCK